MMKAIEKSISVIIKICYIILICVGVSMAVFSFANAISRKVGSSALTWTDEINRYCFIYTTFLGMIVCAHYQRHAYVDLVLEKLNFKIRQVVEAIGNLITIAFLVIVFYGEMDMMKTAGITLSPTLHIPLNYIYLSLPLGAVLSIFIYIWKIVLCMYNFVNSYKGGEKQ